MTIFQNDFLQTRGSKVTTPKTSIRSPQTKKTVVNFLATKAVVATGNGLTHDKEAKKDSSSKKIIIIASSASSVGLLLIVVLSVAVASWLSRK